jgi:hypothetical protein
MDTHLTFHILFIRIYREVLSEKIQLLAVIQSTSSFLLQKSAQMISNISALNKFLEVPSSLPFITDLVSLKNSFLFNVPELSLSIFENILLKFSFFLSTYQHSKIKKGLY